MNEANFSRRPYKIVQLQRHTKNDGILSNPVWSLIFILLHIPLGLIVSEKSVFTTLHALIVLFIGVFWALSKKRIERSTYIIAYITGAEVLWRMTDARVFYEYGKYSVVLISLISIIVLLRQRGRLKTSALIIWYFILLTPSILITLLNFAPNIAMDKISFNLSGPLAIMFCVLIFSNINITKAQFNNMLIAFVAPIVTMAIVATNNVLLHGSFEFTGQSNLLLSTNISPNQISSIFGLGMFIIFTLLVLDSNHYTLLRILFVGLICAFFVLSALTFSRGGLYLAGISILVLVTLFIRGQWRFTAIGIIFIIAVVAQFGLFPFLENYTGGAFFERFGDISPSMRDQIGAADLKIWLDNPIYGVGPGGAVGFRRELLSLGASAHTEYTRVLAEHGILGLVSMFFLFVYIGGLLKTHYQTPFWGIAWALVIWALLYFLINDTRLVAPAFVIGIVSMKISYN